MPAAIAEIEIAELHPGEYALWGEKIAMLHATLGAGTKLTPICVYNFSGRLIVHDGNNRVRAWIAFHQSQNQKMPPIPCVITVPTLQEMPKSLRNQWEQIADYFGKGPEGFLRIRVSNDATGESFAAVHAEERLGISSIDNRRN
jgi:hypothetical protein